MEVFAEKTSHCYRPRIILSTRHIALFHTTITRNSMSWKCRHSFLLLSLKRSISLKQRSRRFSQYPREWDCCFCRRHRDVFALISLQDQGLHSDHSDHHQYSSLCMIWFVEEFKKQKSIFKGGMGRWGWKKQARKASQNETTDLIWHIKEKKK